MAAARRDLLADDHFEPHPARLGHRPGRQCSVDAFVVGDGDHVEPGAVLGMVEDLRDARHPVRGERVDVQIGATHQLFASTGPGCAGMSSQIWKNSVHHCSGASAMTRSKILIWFAMKPVMRSFGVPIAGRSRR